MRATIKNYLEAEKARREEEGREGGFSLIELIIVVVILGILVAIAIPVFGSIQQQAERSSLEAAAANGATAVAAAIADGDSTSSVANAIAKGTNSKIVLTTNNTDTSKVDTVCVKAAKVGELTTYAQAGPGCSGAAHSWTP
ncbi:MAG: type II secretion system protein [Microbacterium sp.]|uniref:type II secretion system protein n=1 Tax=Microbacterium sp. TaxID=51671 RepID=UPI003F7F0D18